jgi:ribosomal protein S7
MLMLPFTASISPEWSILNVRLTTAVVKVSVDVDKLRRKNNSERVATGTRTIHRSLVI